MAKIPERVVVAMSPQSVTINLDELPAHETDSLCRLLTRSVTEYFKLPGVAAEYEQWKAERAKRAAAVAAR
jgi:hypothetical protein